MARPSGAGRLLGALDGFTLVLDRELRVLDASPAARKALNGSQSVSCFEALRGREVPCPSCPALRRSLRRERVAGQELVATHARHRAQAVVAANPLRSSDGAPCSVSC